MAQVESPDFSRPVRVSDIPGDGLDVAITATPPECAGLAELFELPEVKAFSGQFHLVREGRLVTVTGKIEGVVTQTCVVTLEPFDEVVDEEVYAEFSEDAEPLPDFDEIADEDLEGVIQGVDLDAPEAIIDGKIDLGILAMEFLALSMDPYPRKPGVEFDPGPEPERDSPFADLAKLKPRSGD